MKRSADDSYAERAACPLYTAIGVIDLARPGSEHGTLVSPPAIRRPPISA